MGVIHNPYFLTPPRVFWVFLGVVLVVVIVVNFVMLINY